MIANEIKDGKVLMIGDLIIGCIETDIVDETTYKILCKVTGISHYGDVSCEALKSFPDELDWQDGDDFSWIEAIPLTAEILEKNGFLNDGVSFWYLDFRIVLSTSKGVSLVCGRQKRFEYVHELQHALRLAGIDKEIIL